MPALQKRLGELDAGMAKESFWNHREQAQKQIDEANTIRKKLGPLLESEKRLDDSRMMVELAESEPSAAQPPLQQDLLARFERFGKLGQLTAQHFLELIVGHDLLRQRLRVRPFGNWQWVRARDRGLLEIRVSSPDRLEPAEIANKASTRKSRNRSRRCVNPISESLSWSISLTTIKLCQSVGFMPKQKTEGYANGK